MPQVIKLSNYLQTESFDDQLKSISQNLDLLSKKFIEVIENVKRTNTELSTQAATQSQTNKAIKDTNKNLDKLSEAEKQTNKLREQSNKLIVQARAERTKEGKELVKVKIARQEQNKKIQEEIKYNKAAKGSIDELKARYALLTKQYQKLSAVQREGAMGKGILRNIQDTDKQIKNLNQSMGKHQDSVGNYGKAFSGLKGILGGFGIALGGAAIATKVFNAVMQSTQTLADGFQKVMTQAKAGVDFFFRAIATGDWKDFGKRFKEVMVAAGQYADTMDRTGDLTRSLEVQQEKAAIRLGELEVAYKDVTKTEKERVAALDEYLAIEKDLHVKRMEYAKLEYDATVKRVAVELGLSEDKVKSLSEEYDTMEDLLAKGKVYNDFIKKQNDLEKEKIRAQAAYSGMYGGNIQMQLQSAREYNDKIAEVRKEIEGLGEEYKKAGEIQAKYQSSNDAMLKEVADKAKAYYAAEASFNDETVKAQTKRSTLLSEIMKKEEKAAKKTIELLNLDMNEINKQTDNFLDQFLNDITNQEKEINAEKLKQIDDNAQKEINILKEKYLNGIITQEQYSKEVTAIEIKAMEESLGVAFLTADQKLAIETNLLDMKIGLMKTEADAQADADKEKIEQAKKTQETLMDIAKMGFDTATMYIDMQESNLEMMYDYEIERAGDNEALKERIDKKYDGERKKLQRQQAIAKKAEGIFSAIINTAQGVTSALKVDPPLGIALAIIVGAIGAAQIGIIASQDIPKFEKGSKGLPVPMLAEYGEKGREIVQEPGKIPYLAEQSTISYLPKGTKIIPNYETERILAGNGGVTDAKFNELIREERKTRQELKARPVNQTNITRDGFEYLTRTGHNTIKWNNKYFP